MTLKVNHHAATIGFIIFIPFLLMMNVQIFKQKRLKPVGFSRYPPAEKPWIPMT
jgi:hypothetical protein